MVTKRKGVLGARTLLTKLDTADVIPAKPVRGTSSSSPDRVCPIHRVSTHVLDNCSDFNSMSNEEKLEFFKLNNLCFRCLEPGHRRPNCKIVPKCLEFNNMHMTSMHFTPFVQRYLAKQDQKMFFM